MSKNEEVGFASALRAGVGPPLNALIADAMHKALDAVDEGWHLSCLEPDADEGSGSCFKGHAARRMLEEDVAPTVVARVAEALWTEAQRIRAADWPARVGIEYVNGFEAAATWVERKGAA